MADCTIYLYNTETLCSVLLLYPRNDDEQRLTSHKTAQRDARSLQFGRTQFAIFVRLTLAVFLSFLPL